MQRWKLMFAIGFCGVAFSIPATSTTCFGGTAQKWDDVPKAVRDTVLANGGRAGPVDKEKETKDGKAVYEFSVKGADGQVKDLEITEDGKLIEIKTDDASDQIAERRERGKKILAAAKFTHPTHITNPWLPLSLLKKDVLEGIEDGKTTRVERTSKPDIHKMFKVGDQTIEALAFEDRGFENGKLSEVAIDYFAQDDAGTVYYLGENVDEYKDGIIVGNKESWLLGKDTEVPGIAMPANPKVGDKFRLEDVSSEISEKDEVVSDSETVTVPFGTFKGCLKIKERQADGSVEFAYYAKGIGAVREVPSNGDELLISHEAR